MGFTLTIAPIADAGSGCEDEILQFLGSNLSKIRDVVDIRPDGFPFFVEEFEDDDGKPICFIAHEEVGWSWWDQVVAEISDDLGPESVRACSHMKAWLGAALPFDTENAYLGDPLRRVPEGGPLPTPGIKGFFSRLFKKPTPIDPNVQRLIDRMVDERSGGTSACIVGSGVRVLAELEAACRHWGYPDDEQEASQLASQLYEDATEDESLIPRCYALMCRSFFRFAVANGYIVWFIK